MFAAGRPVMVTDESLSEKLLGKSPTSTGQTKGRNTALKFSGLLSSGITVPLIDAN
jgi:hypothetical protein